MTTVNLNLIPVDETQLVLAAGDDTQLVLSAGDETQIVLSSVAISNGLMMTDGSNSALALGSAGTPSLKFAGDANTGIFSPSADQFSITTGGTERLRIDSAGQIEAVSLGSAAAPTFSFTSDPNTGVYSPGADQLAISTGGLRRLFIQNNEFRFGAPDSNTVVFNIGNEATGDRAVYADLITDTTYTDFGLRLGREGGANSTSFLWHRGTNDFLFLTTEAAPIKFSTSSVERLRITSAGNVGIGTSSPSAILDVRQNQAAYSYFDFYNTTAGGGIVWRQIVRNLADTGTTSIDLVKYTSGGFAIANNDTGAANFTAFNVGASERLRITSAGRVGIGTTSPGQQLSVTTATNDDGIILTNSSTNGGRLRLNSTGTGGRAYHIVSTADGSGAGGGKFCIFDNTASDAARFAITSAGNVGIGTTSPAYALDVQAGDARFKRSASDDAAIYFGSTTNNYIFGSNTGNLFVFATNGSERARIDSSGRLLVGTSSARNVAAALQWNQQIEGTFYTGLSIVNNQAGSQNAYLVLGKSRGTTIGSSTIVSNNDGLGAILFAGADGTDLETQAGQIACEVDGTPGANDMPGRLVFSTTADGASSPTERMRIKSTGIVNIANTPTYADNAAATAGGLVAGDIYRTSTGQLMIRY